MDQKPIINLDVIDIQTPNYDPKINQNEFFIINPIQKINNKRKLNTNQIDFRSTILGEHQSFTTLTISKKLKK
jgi:hypothetical protein